MIAIKAIRHIEPPPHVVSSEWLPLNVTMPAGTETSGQPFSLASFPHVDGVLAAFDDATPRVTVAARVRAPAEATENCITDFIGWG